MALAGAVQVKCSASDALRRGESLGEQGLVMDAAVCPDHKWRVAFFQVRLGKAKDNQDSRPERG